MTAWCKMTPLPIVAVNTNYMLQDFKAGGHVGRSPHQLSARGAAEAEPHSGPFTLTVIRHVTRQVWVTGGLARGRGCSGSLPGGSCWNTPSPLKSRGREPGAVPAKVEQLRKFQISCCVLGLSMGTPWQGVGTYGLISGQ